MTQKKTMTKAEAQEWLKDKYVKVKSLGRAKKMCDKILSLGFNIKGDHWRANEFLYFTLSGSLDQKTWEFTSMLHNDETEIDLSDLLSIEIVEDPDPSELLKEAVGLLDGVRETFAAGSNEENILMNRISKFLTKHSGRV